jgi:ferrochelatase
MDGAHNMAIPSQPKRLALLFYNMGGPGHAAEVQPFLESLFSDHDLLAMPLPQAMQNRIAHRIAARRTPEIIEKYHEIGGGSPQLAITEKLMGRVCQKLQSDAMLPAAWEVVFASPLMRYTEPRALTCWKNAVAAGATEIWLISQYPHCARATTGSSVRDFALTVTRQAEGRHGQPAVRSLASYGDHPAFHELWAKRLATHWNSLPQDSRHLIVSAHNLPISYIASGDPYRDQIDRCARQTMKHLGLCEGRDWTLAWQSAVGPVRWMQPDTRDVMRNLASRSIMNQLVWPIAFVSDHIETQHEIDIEFGQIAKDLGLHRFERVTNLNADDDFVRFLSDRVAAAAQDVAAHGVSLAARLLDDHPSGEGCHRQPGGCLCGRYWQAGRQGRTKGVSTLRLSAPSLAK